MREIKFRAWDKENKKFYDDIFGIDNSGQVILIEQGTIWTTPEYVVAKNCIPLQYTGIRDKNGKEIYEGDILSGIAFYNGNDYGGPVKKEEYYIHKDVEFSEGCYMCGGFALNEISRYMEVIGNIYENPELINKGKD